MVPPESAPDARAALHRRGPLSPGLTNRPGRLPDTCVPPTMTLNALGKRLGQAQTQWRIFEFRMLRPAIIGAVKAARRWREAPAAPAPAPPAASAVPDFASPRISDLGSTRSTQTPSSL